MVYPLPLDAAYRSSKTEIEFLVLLFDSCAIFLSIFRTNPTDCLSLVSGQFLKELRENTFSGSDNEDANEHVEKVFEIVDLFHVPNITTTEDAKKAIQEMAEYSQKWHIGTSRGRSTETSNGLAAIQAELNNLGREVKKVNEKVYAAQVGCEQCKGPHYTKDYP
ncbi:hypothetical protein Tco_0954650 [Tanacetum coccineum]|uniref:Uncharacterized protein n=1 Tax=Tanacetum coccineum TaxID=301880 RepID=A0ABQ5E503_9ASTR